MVPSRSQAISSSHIDVARVIGRDQMLAPVLDPFHRPADGLRCERNEEILRIELAAHAEGAADVALDHGDGVFRERKLRREDTPDGEGDLGGAIDRQVAARRVPIGEQAARLHRHRGVALHPEALAPHIRRVLECGVGVAAHRGQCRRAVRRRAVDQQRIVRAAARPRPATLRCRARSPPAHPRQPPRCRRRRPRSARRHSGPCRARSPAARRA